MKQNESGRSMIEMLGVLAVVGMLSVGAFAAIRLGWNKARASNLVAEMNRLAHMFSMHQQVGYTTEALVSLANEYNAGTEYKATYASRTSQVFGLTLNNPVDKALCE